jgi:hypothetical protein
MNDNKEKYVSNPLDRGTILEYFPNYIIYKSGKVYSMKAKRYLENNERDGYHFLSLYNKDGKREQHGVHRLVAFAYLDNDDFEVYTFVNHKDGNKLNNQLSNLEWCTPTHNMQHAVKTGLTKHGGKFVYRCDINGDILAEYESITVAVKESKTSRRTIIKSLQTGKLYGNYIWKYKEKEEIKEKFRELEDEMWFYLELPVYKDIYKISSNGRIWSDFSTKFLKPSEKDDGYLRINFQRKMYYIHILVATMFVEMPADIDDKRYIVNHIDGNKQNNCHWNLEWITQKQNVQHAHSIGSFKKRRKVVQLDLDLNVVEIYANTTKVFESNSKFKVQTISSACSKRMPAYDYFWLYEEDHTEENLKKLKRHKKRIVQYTLNCKKIKTFNSVKEAGIELDINPSDISRALSGKKKNRSYGGYQWRYINEPPPTEPIRKPGVLQYSKDGKLIKKWSSIIEASRALGIGDSHISQVCKGKRQTTGGFVWKYPY